MGRSVAVLMLALAACMAGAQQKPADQTEPPVPKGGCHYFKYAPVLQIKADPALEDFAHFDLSSLKEHRVTFRRGAIVTVNLRAGAWSCVSGTFWEPATGWKFRTGWMKTDLLGPVEEQPPASGIDPR